MHWHLSHVLHLVLHRHITNTTLTHYYTRTHTHTRDNFLPAQHTQNEIENEKGAEDDERDKIDPRQLIAHSILHLRESRERERRGGETERRG